MKILKNLLIEGRHNKPIVTDIFYEENKEPKKVVKKIYPAPKTSDDALASIVDDWDD